MSSDGMTFLDELTAKAERQEAQAWVIRWPRKTLWWLRRRAKHAPRDFAGSVHRAWQRLTRGWDYRSVWGLDTYLARTLGAQLVYMADIAHGWPDPYPGDFEGWVADLRRHGEALQAFYRDRYDGGMEQEPYAAAQVAIHWVADNFGALWD